jgi:hypothetical protein
MTIVVRKKFFVHEIFYKLEVEKQNRIINAEMNIFSIVSNLLLTIHYQIQRGL